MKTKRLTIRPIEADDWPALKEIWEDFNRSPYVIYDNVKSTDPDEVKTRIARWAEATQNGKEHIFMVTCYEDKVIGFTSLNAYADGYDIGYGFLDRFQGKGYAAESLSAIAEYAKNLGARKLYAGTAIKNLPSMALLKRLGFTLVGTEQVSFHKDEQGNDICFEGGNFEKAL